MALLKGPFAKPKGPFSYENFLKVRWWHVDTMQDYEL